jgi:hypothetical protein
MKTSTYNKIVEENIQFRKCCPKVKNSENVTPKNEK